MKVFFDTETTGKCEFRLPPHHPAQPHIVQLAALLTEDDGEERGSIDLIIRPDGWTIPDEAAAIHGITQEIAMRCGVPLMSAMSVFSMFCSQADTVIAHNLDFDLLVAQKAYHWLRKDHRFSTMNKVCTMKLSTPLCKLPHPKPWPGSGPYKWPKLEEAMEVLLKKKLVAAHSALADVKGCAELHFFIRQCPEANAGTLFPTTA